jgi:hypothetical protein
MGATIKNGNIVRINNMDFLNKSVIASKKEDYEPLSKLISSMLSRIEGYGVTIKGLVLTTEGEYNDHVSLYCWCDATHGFIITRGANGAYSVYLVNATEYEGRFFVSQSQLDWGAREHIMPMEHRTGNWQ